MIRNLIYFTLPLTMLLLVACNSEQDLLSQMIRLKWPMCKNNRRQRLRLRTNQIRRHKNDSQATRCSKSMAVTCLDIAKETSS